MIIVHGLKTCDTCRRALKALRADGLDAILRDFRDTPPDTAEIADWRARLGPALLNTRSTTWRRLDAQARGGDPVALMVAHPALVKRPVVTRGDEVGLGWTEATRGALGLSG